MSEGLTLLILSPKYPPLKGGAATYVRTLASKLSGTITRPKIIILTEYVSGAPLMERNGNLLILRILPPRSQLAPGGTVVKVLSLIAFWIEITIVLPYLVWAHRIDVLHVHAYFTRIRRKKRNRWMTWLLKRLNVPVVLDIRDQFTIPADDAFSDGVICASEAIYQAAIRSTHRPDKYAHIPIPFERDLSNGLDEAWVDRRSVPMPYVCFVGDINRNKGVFELLEAFQRLRQEEVYAGHWLVLAGPNNEGAHFRVLVDARAQIDYLGDVTHEQALALMKHSELTVLPSKSEGMPRVCLEAFAIGTRVLCPPGIPEFDEACPDAVIPEITPEAIAAKLQEELARDRVPDQAYDLTPHDPARVAEQVISLYERVVGTHGQR